MPKKQMEIPGTERPVIKGIEQAAEDYVSVRDKRKALTDREVDLKAALLAAMKKHEDKLRQPDGSLLYQFDGQLVVAQHSENVKVRKWDEDGDESDDD